MKPETPVVPAVKLKKKFIVNLLQLGQSNFIGIAEVELTFAAMVENADSILDSIVEDDILLMRSVSLGAPK
jgi:hypothetical protein